MTLRKLCHAGGFLVFIYCLVLGRKLGVWGRSKHTKKHTLLTYWIVETI